MSTSGDIASLAADLVVFLGAASLLAVLIVRADFLRVSGPVRNALAVAATLLAFTALLRGAVLDPGAGSGGLVGALRAISIVFLAAGSLRARSRWPRRALVSAVALLAGAELAIRGNASEELVAGLRFLGGCGMGAALSIAARRTLATRIASAAGVLLVVVVLVLSGVLSRVLRDNVASQALETSAKRARIEARLVQERSDLAFSQAGFITKVLTLSDTGLQAVRQGDADAIRKLLRRLNEEYSQVDFLAYFDAKATLSASALRPGVPERALLDLGTSSVVQEAFKESLAASASGVEPTRSSGLIALGVQQVQFPDDRGVPKNYGAIAAGFFLDDKYLLGRLDESESGIYDMSIVAAPDWVLATTIKGKLGAASELLDGRPGRRLMRAPFNGGAGGEGQGQFRGEDVFVAVATVPPAEARPPDKPPEAAIVVTVDGQVITAARESLFQKLFLVASVAAALALALASAAGARLGAPLRALAGAAERISRGDLSVRTGLRGPDEIGLLGGAFDEMAASIEQKTSELREGSAQLEAVLNSVTDGLIATDEVGLVELVNPAAEAMLGVRGSRERGRPISEVVRATDRQGNSLAERFEIPNLDAWSVVGFVENRGGSLPVALSGAPIRSESPGVLGAVYVMRDLRGELEIERAKTEFLSNISHELRTPLTPIKGYAEMLRRSQDRDVGARLTPAKMTAFLDGILESSERLERTVDILVNFAAMSSGRLVLRPEPVDVEAMLREVCARWRSRSDHHRVDEHVSGKPRVLADRRLLERSIDELIDNAVKYSPEGGHVAVRAKLVGTAADRAVELSVVDEGIGIAPGDLERVFADFSQIDGSATRRFGGLGLGLPFVQRVVAAHGGAIEATSKPGRGSTFVFRIPVAPLPPGDTNGGSARPAP